MRNRYLDLLRAAAIVRVIVYHLFGWPWLSVVLPAMGIMFALAGSLTAASLRKRAAEQVVAARLRRVLPPLWLLGVVAVPVMLVAGWAQETDGEHPFRLSRLLLWILPIGDPPGSEQGIDVWEPLWYIRAYVWFALLSPALFGLYRRIGWAAVALPLALMGVLDLTGFTLPETADAALWDFVTYGACWIAGFAHQDGRLARLKPWAVAGVAVVLGGAALYWLRENSGAESWDLNDVSESQALWSLAFVLVALRWQPPMGWLARIRPLDAAVNLVNARAVTFYLWHNIAIAAVWPVLTVLTLDELGGRVEWAADLGIAIVLTLVAVLAFGWAEDLAARRRPRLWPTAGAALRTESAEGQSSVRSRAVAGRLDGPSSIRSGAVPERLDGQSSVRSGAVGRLDGQPPGLAGRPDGQPSGRSSAAAERPDGSAGLPLVGAVIDAPVRRQPSAAAAAMSRMPAAWPPAPRTAGHPAIPEPEVPNTQARIIEEWVATTQPDGRHAVSRDKTRDLALPTGDETRDLSSLAGEPDDRAEPDEQDEQAEPDEPDEPDEQAEHEGRARSAGGDSRDLGLPVAGRRAEPLAGAESGGETLDWFRPRHSPEDLRKQEQ